MPDSNHTFQAIKRSKAVEDVLDAFKGAIIRGELRPGQRVPSETKLAEDLGLGRGTIREAMKMLEALGAVRIQQGDGTYVADKPSSTLLSPLVFAILLESNVGSELLELRALFQVGYCQLAAAKAKQDDWRSVEAAGEAFSKYARSPKRDVEELTRLDLDFHFAILDATHNPLVIKIGRTVEEIFFASIRSTLSGMENLEWAIESHRNVIAKMKAGDGDQIYRAVVASLAAWGSEVEKRTQPSEAVSA